MNQSINKRSHDIAVDTHIYTLTKIQGYTQKDSNKDTDIDRKIV